MQGNENREITYYTLLNRSNQRHIEEMADIMPQEDFVKLEYAGKWLEHLWVSANNEAFLSHISQIKDIVKLDYTLREQIKSYARKNGEGNEQHKGDLYRTYISRKNWLSQTIFICKDEYKKASNEVFNEVVKWCESFQNEWLEYYNPSQIGVIDNGNPTTSATVGNKNLLLKHREIALIYWYDRDCLSIDLKTSQKIAEDNGHKSKTSGLSLYNDHYTKVRDKAEERTDNARSEEYLNNIIPRLTTERGKREANEDLTKAKYLKEKKKMRLFY